MHAFQFSRPFSRALVRVVCLHVKGLSALLPEHKIGTGEMLDFCCFFLYVVRQPEFSILHILLRVISAIVRFVCCQCFSLGMCPLLVSQEMFFFFSLVFVPYPTP